MQRRAVLAGLAAAASAGLAGCGGVVGSGNEGSYDVGMGHSVYEPREVTVSVGDTVVWRNTSQRAHTVTAYDDGLPEGADFFASGGYGSTEAAREAWRGETGGAIYSDATYEHTFEVAGEYPYFCIPHERQGMVGTVVVEE